MTALPSSEQQQVSPELPIEGPGTRLRKARQAQGLEQNRVAAQLHLSEAMIEALEWDNYEALPGAVFVQGYLRNYARLLGVAEDEVLSAYQHLCPEIEHDSLRDKSTSTISNEVRSSHGAVQLVTWLIVIGLVTLLVIWWQGRLDWEDESLIQTPATDQVVTEVPVIEDEPLPTFGQSAFDVQGRPSVAGGRTPGATDVQGRPSVAGGRTPGATDLQERPNLTGNAAEGNAGVTDATRTPEVSLNLPPADRARTDLPQLPETLPVSESVPADLAVTTPPVEEPPLIPEPVAEPSFQPVAVAPATIEQSAGVVTEAAPATGQLVFEFSGPCWAEVRDSSGRARIIGEMRSGARRVLDAGLGPFKIVLGDARAVQLSVDGRPYDLAPHIRGKVARFTLDQGSP